MARKTTRRNVLKFLAGGALPWSVVEPKLAPEGALVVSLSPYLVGHARRADYVVPAPAWLEGIEEAPAPPGEPCACLGLSIPMPP